MLPIRLISHRNLALRAYLDRVRAVGAVSPASALPRERLPPLDDADFLGLVDRGDLREAILFLLPLIVMQLLD